MRVELNILGEAQNKPINKIVTLIIAGMNSCATDKNLPLKFIAKSIC